MAVVTISSDFGAQKIKSDTVSTVSPSISHEVMRPDAIGENKWSLRKMNELSEHEKYTSLWQFGFDILSSSDSHTWWWETSGKGFMKIEFFLEDLSLGW